MTRTHKLTLVSICCLFLAACGSDKPDRATADTEVQPEVQPAAEQPSLIEASVANSRRPPDDIARDINRKPAKVLQFIGIEPDMVVLDMYSGGGYYAELLSYAVGNDGRVIAHNNTPYATLAGKNIEARFSDGHLSNVEQLIGENNQLKLEADTFDAVLFILSYHDVYYIDGERGWELVDRPMMLAEIFRAMKPGAVLGLVDHVAAAGMPKEAVAPLHRVDPELVKADFLAAGFVLEAESDVLRNPADDYNMLPMLPQIRGRSDRMLLRFIKPAN
jgi:predicted methyltransferase